jgi:hypothetical protein
MSLGARQYMEEDLVDEIVTTPKQPKSLMSYVGYVIAAGVAGIVAMLFFMEVIFK